MKDSIGMVDPARPLVSIGVPAFNEERYVDAALRALRAQDYPNLEIIVCDNASSDRTASICERHATEDARVRLVRAESNDGAIANFRRALAEAKGRYFMWAGAHDLVSSNYVSECLALLESEPAASLAFPTTRWIGPDDEPLPRASGWTDTRGLAPAARFFTVFWGNMHPVMGLMRIEVLRRCTPMRNIVGADLALLSELALAGHFLHAGSATWSRREFRVEHSHADKLRRYAAPETGISRSPLSRRLPLLALPFALLSVVWNSSMQPVMKAATLVALLASMPLRFLVGHNVADVDR
jgi:glycosyltransferase involved in cell wall biosynthesis